MKKSKLSILCVLTCLALVFSMPYNGGAEPAGSPQIVVINIQSAISSTTDGRREFESLERKFEPERIDLKTKNDEIESLKRQYEAQGAKLNDEARTTLSVQISGKQRALSRLQDDVEADFREQQSRIVQKILRKLAPVIDKYAKEKGVGLVIDNSKPWPEWPTVWVSTSTDITKQIVDIYNAGLTSPSPQPSPR